MSGDRIRLEVRPRGDGDLGSRHSRRLRREGLVPGVLYGKGSSRALVVGERDLRAALGGPSGLNAILDVVFEGQQTEHHAVLKEFQRHPVRGTVTHVDLHEIRLDRPIQATVPVQLVGEAPGVKVGGVLQMVVRELNVEALPMAIPERLDIDVSGLELDSVLRLEEVPPVEGVSFLDDLHETVIATVSVPRVIEEPVEVEEAEGEEAQALEEGAGPEATAEEPAESGGGSAAED